MGDTFVSGPGYKLSGSVDVPGDKSISHRALIVGALASGRSQIVGLSNGLDVLNTARAVRMLGATLEKGSSVGGRTTLLIDGGPRRLHEPSDVIDLGNSGTGMRLLAGAVAGFQWVTLLSGDDSLSSRPMDRITNPLRQMGAKIYGRQDAMFAPLMVKGGDLSGIDYAPPVSSAQVKSAILLAGLRAEGETIVRESVTTRSHTEELLLQSGVNLKVSPNGAGQIIELVPGPLDPIDIDVCADPSQAAFWIVAATIVPGSHIVLENVYCGADRIGFIDVLKKMGADIQLEPSGPTGHTGAASHTDPTSHTGPTGSSGGALRARIEVKYSGTLQGITISGDDIIGLDEVPILAVAACCAQGETIFTDVGDLRAKESDRITSLDSELGKLGAKLTVEGQGSFRIEGTPFVSGSGSKVRSSPFEGGRVDSRGDHRIAMACAIAGLVSKEPVTISGWSCVASSYPSFADHFRKLTRWNTEPVLS